MIRTLPTLVLAVVVAAVAFGGASGQGLPPREPSVGDDAIAQWLPHFGDPRDAWRHGLALPVRVRQTYVVDGKTRSGLLQGSVILDALEGGTFISFGSTGPVTGHVAFDGIASIAYYHIGCCGSYDWAIGKMPGPPPYPVASQRLDRIRTTRGVALGDSVKKVQERVGPARLEPLIGRPGYAELSYVWFVYPSAPQGSPGSGCGQWQNFIFDRGKLAFIDLTDAC